MNIYFMSGTEQKQNKIAFPSVFRHECDRPQIPENLWRATLLEKLPGSFSNEDEEMLFLTFFYYCFLLFFYGIISENFLLSSWTHFFYKNLFYKNRRSSKTERLNLFSFFLSVYKQWGVYNKHFITRVPRLYGLYSLAKNIYLTRSLPLARSINIFDSWI